jgi:hypothetical protein
VARPIGAGTCYCASANSTLDLSGVKWPLSHTSNYFKTASDCLRTYKPESFQVRL